MRRLRKKRRRNRIRYYNRNVGFRQKEFELRRKFRDHSIYYGFEDWSLERNQLNSVAAFKRWYMNRENPWGFYQSKAFSLSEITQQERIDNRTKINLEAGEYAPGDIFFLPDIDEDRWLDEKMYYETKDYPYIPPRWRPYNSWDQRIQQDEFEDWEFYTAEEESFDNYTKWEFEGGMREDWEFFERLMGRTYIHLLRQMPYRTKKRRALNKMDQLTYPDEMKTWRVWVQHLSRVEGKFWESFIGELQGPLDDLDPPRTWEEEAVLGPLENISSKYLQMFSHMSAKFLLDDNTKLLQTKNAYPIYYNPIINNNYKKKINNTLFAKFERLFEQNDKTFSYFSEKEFGKYLFNSKDFANLLRLSAHDYGNDTYLELNQYLHMIKNYFSFLNIEIKTDSKLLSFYNYIKILLNEDIKNSPLETQIYEEIQEILSKINFDNLKEVHRFPLLVIWTPLHYLSFFLEIYFLRLREVYLDRFEPFWIDMFEDAESVYDVKGVILNKTFPHSRFWLLSYNLKQDLAAFYSLPFVQEILTSPKQLPPERLFTKFLENFPKTSKKKTIAHLLFYPKLNIDSSFQRNWQSFSPFKSLRLQRGRAFTKSKFFDNTDTEFKQLHGIPVTILGTIFFFCKTLLASLKSLFSQVRDKNYLYRLIMFLNDLTIKQKIFTEKNDIDSEWMDSDPEIEDLLKGSFRLANEDEIYSTVIPVVKTAKEKDDYDDSTELSFEQEFWNIYSENEAELIKIFWIKLKIKLLDIYSVIIGSWAKFIPYKGQNFSLCLESTKFLLYRHLTSLTCIFLTCFFLCILPHKIQKFNRIYISAVVFRRRIKLKYARIWNRVKLFPTWHKKYKIRQKFPQKRKKLKVLNLLSRITYNKSLRKRFYKFRIYKQKLLREKLKRQRKRERARAKQRGERDFESERRRAWARATRQFKKDLKAKEQREKELKEMAAQWDKIKEALNSLNIKKGPNS